MAHSRRLFSLLTALALALPFASRANATPLASGTFSGDNSFFSYSFTTASNQQFTFATTSFASGGFVPVLTFFNAAGGNPLAFAENDMGDVSLSLLLGPGSYILVLTEDPNVFTTTYAAGTLFSSPTATGDLCGVSGGKFLNVFDNCSQRTGNYAVNITNTAAVTPEPPTWLLVMPAVALLFAVKYSRPTA